jgi:hypothetical protein
MRRTIRAALGENARSLGTLRFDAQGARENAAFEYDAAWLAATDGFAIDPGLPLVAAPQFHRCPDGKPMKEPEVSVPGLLAVSREAEGREPPTTHRRFFSEHALLRRSVIRSRLLAQAS